MLSTTMQAVSFASASRPPITLEGRIHVPAGGAKGVRYPGAILCHPQPLTSDMQDPLTVAIAEDLAANGVAALRFNFRGVGRSEGEQTDGRLEPLDLAGAVASLLGQPYIQPEAFYLVGHGFGAYVALVYAQHDPRVGAVVAISPPAVWLSPQLGTFAQPKLVLSGEFDEVAPRHLLEAWLETVPNRQLQVVTGAQYFMRGYEQVAAHATVTYLTRLASRSDR